jgi:hypothetical protein
MPVILEEERGCRTDTIVKVELCMAVVTMNRAYEGIKKTHTGPEITRLVIK